MRPSLQRAIRSRYGEHDGRKPDRHGFKQLRDEYNWPVERIAQKIDKSAAHVYQRLKLCELCEDGRKAFFAGKLTPASALVIARIRRALAELAVLALEVDRAP